MEDGVDSLPCPRCGGKLRLIATIIEQPAITAILDSLGLASSPPFACAPAPDQQLDSDPVLSVAWLLLADGTPRSEAALPIPRHGLFRCRMDSFRKVQKRPDDAAVRIVLGAQRGADPRLHVDDCDAIPK